MLKLGEDNILTVDRETTVGMFLTDGEGNDVLLPNKYVDDDIKIGDELTVFVYLDSNERVIATNIEPYIKLNRFAYLEAKQNTEFGMFMDWGLEKDLLVPFREQASDMEKGKWYVVFLYLDSETNRLVGSTRTSRHIETENIELEEGQKVEILITGKTDLGWNVIIDNLYRGLIYHNEIFREIFPGDITNAFVKKVREDGKIDISLQKIGYDGIEPLSVKIINELIKNSGFLPLTDKSSPQEILLTFEMSKKTFKKAIGSLYKQKIIKIEKDGIYLNEE